MTQLRWGSGSVPSDITRSTRNIFYFFHTNFNEISQRLISFISILHKFEQLIW